MTYTIKQIAKMASVSVRTLHYYDQIGLLKPSSVGENGYRHYEEKELIKLQQILFFRELDFSLNQIKKMVDDSNFNVLNALDDQRKLLLLERSRLDELLRTINKTLGKLKGENIMNNEDLFEGLSKDQIEKHKDEVRERWGNTVAYKQSVERTKNWTKEDYKRIKEENDRIAYDLVANIEKEIEDPKVQAVIKQHWEQINKFYDCSMEMYKCLAKMYIEDERFTDHYRKYHKNLPEFLSKAMVYFADNHK